MPTIAKTKVQPKKNLFNEQSRADRQLIYQSDKWKKLRLAKLIDQPLCEICLAKGIIKSGLDIHHIISPFSIDGRSNPDYYAYDPDNLLTVCKECLGTLHSEHKEATLYKIYYDRKTGNNN